MLDYIEALRTKPDYIRKRYAFAIAFCVTLIIAGVWTNATIKRFAPVAVTVVATEDTQSSFSRTFRDFRSYLHAAVVAFKPTVEYVKEEPVVSKVNRLDLDALVASSTKAALDSVDKESIGTKATTSSSISQPAHAQ